MTEAINKEINEILDEWDPLGINPKNGINSYGEYNRYVKLIIQVYLSKQSVYDYLVKMQEDLWDYPNDEMKNDIRQASEKIVNLLSEYKMEDLQKCL